MQAAAFVALLIASVIEQLSSAPVAFHWRAEDAVIEAASVSPDGRDVVFWCEGLHGSNSRCFAQFANDAPLPIFRGGAIDAADRPLRSPFANVRHFSMNGGRIAWKHGVPVFLVACHTGAIMGICEQVLGEEPLVAGSTASPLESRAVQIGGTTVWNDRELSRTIFRSGDRTLNVCCAGDDAAYALAPMAGGDMLLIYSGAGRHADLRAALIAPDLRIRRETVLAQNIVPPTSIDAVSTPERTFVVWSGGGVFAAIGSEVVKLGDSGETPVIASDGKRVIAAWLDGDGVMTAELSRADSARSLLALRASSAARFLALDWSPSTGFVVQWRARSNDRDDVVIATRRIP